MVKGEGGFQWAEVAKRGGAATIELRATKGRRSFCCHGDDTSVSCMWQLPVPFPAANAPEDAAADNEEWDNSVQMKVGFLEQRIINWMWVNFELEEQ